MRKSLSGAASGFGNSDSDKKKWERKDVKFLDAE